MIAALWHGLSGRLVCSLLLFTLFVFMTGCASVGNGASRYADLLDNWTRSDKIYDGIDVRLSISATYRNREFRYAYVDRYIEAYRLEEGSREAMRAREFEESELYNEFFLSVSTPDKNLNDFISKSSIWKLYLADASGSMLSPVSIKRVSNSSVLTSTLFPYMDAWSVGYIVRFPKYSASGTEPIPNEKSAFLKLMIVGMLGNGELFWELEEQ